MVLTNILKLLIKDLKVELRDFYALSSVLLYVITSTYIVYKAFQQVGTQSWNVLFWIIFLFAALNALIRSFTQESNSKYLYFYQIVHPGELIISKIIFNSLMLVLVSGLLVLAMSLFIFNPIQDYSLFFLSIFLGALGVSTCFTFVASVASSGGENASLMAILALPLVIPILLLLIKLSAQALRIIDATDIKQDLILLGGIDLILFGLAVIIFPVIWRS